jgi:hypothetical protein
MYILLLLLYLKHNSMSSTQIKINMLQISLLLTEFTKIVCNGVSHVQRTVLNTMVLFQKLAGTFCRQIPVNTKEYFLFIDFCFNLYLPLFLFNPRYLAENFISYFDRKLNLIVASGHFPEGRVTGS